MKIRQDLAKQKVYKKIAHPSKRSTMVNATSLNVDKDKAGDIDNVYSEEPTRTEERLTVADDENVVSQEAN